MKVKNNIIEEEEQYNVKIHGNYIQFGEDFLNFISVGRPRLLINGRGLVCINMSFNIGHRKSKGFISHDLGGYWSVPNMK